MKLSIVKIGMLLAFITLGAHACESKPVVKFSDASQNPEGDGSNDPGLAKPPAGVCTGAVQEAFSAGDGSAGNPYIICRADQFTLINKDMDAFYKLGSNLDFSAYASQTTLYLAQSQSAYQ